MDSREELLEEGPDRRLAAVHANRDEVINDILVLQFRHCIEVAAPHLA